METKKEGNKEEIAPTQATPRADGRKGVGSRKYHIQKVRKSLRKKLSPLPERTKNWNTNHPTEFSREVTDFCQKMEIGLESEAKWPKLKRNSKFVCLVSFFKLYNITFTLKNGEPINITVNANRVKLSKLIKCPFVSFIIK